MNENKINIPTKIGISDDEMNIILKNDKGDEIDQIRMIQPIMFKPTDYTSNLFTSQQPCSAPLNAASIINIKAMLDPNTQGLSNNILSNLDFNNIDAMCIMCYNYIASTIFTNFCSLLYNAGPRLSSIVQYLDIKERLYYLLYNEEDNRYIDENIRLIKNIIRSILTGPGSFNNSFAHEYKYSCTLEETKTYMYYATTQLKNEIYSILMNVIDISVNKTYFGIYMPNIDSIINNTMKILDINKSDIDKIGGKENLNTFLAYSIKQLLMSTVEQLMTVVISPAIDELVYALPSNTYYVFDVSKKLNLIDKYPKRYLKKDEDDSSKEDDQYYDYGEF